VCLLRSLCAGSNVFKLFCPTNYSQEYLNNAETDYRMHWQNVHGEQFTSFCEAEHAKMHDKARPRVLSSLFCDTHSRDRDHRRSYPHAPRIRYG